MMWSVVSSILLLSVASLVKSQDNCECISYFFCSGNSTQSSKCTDEFDICCFTDGSSSTSTTEAAQEAPVATEGPGVVKTEQESLCGVRGRLPPSLPPRTSAQPNSETPAVAAPPPDLGSVVDFKVFDELGGDTHTLIGEFPWMVAVMKKNSAGGEEFLCGGSIIYSKMILTSGHNVRGLSARDVVVKAGVWDATDPSEAGRHQDRTVSEIVLHPNFDQQKVEYDIAILVLEEPLTFNTNVRAVCLPSAQLPVNTSNCIATGWGAGNFASQINMSSVLKKVDLPLVNYETCQSRLRQVPKLGSNFNLHNSFICAGGDKVDTCSGDGGGPLMCAMLQDQTRYVQVGVTSWGVGCGQGPPGVYSSVQAAADFIENIHTGVLLTGAIDIKKNERIA